MIIIHFVVFSYHLFSCIILLSVAEVSVFRSTQYIYDKSPTLKIRGTGFDAVDSHDINLELKVDFMQNPLKVNEDYAISKDANGDGLILKLLGNRRWADLSRLPQPVSLYLNSVKFANNNANLLIGAVPVAQILKTPSILENTDLKLYQRVSSELRINGFGFIGAKKVDFYFQPPIKEVAYDVANVPSFSRQSDQIILRLKDGYSWREEAGKLLVVGVDTGGGIIKVNGGAGFQVADVQETLVSIEATAFKQFLYADELITPGIVISGSGFSTVGNSLRFSNDQFSFNYNIVMNSQNSLTLRLVQSYTWNVQNLPALITLLAIDAGQGFVFVGPNMKGQDIAMIFERPSINNDYHTHFKTLTRSFIIHGTGFPTSTTNFKPSLKFEPNLQEYIDYTIRVIDRTTIEITLMDNKEWRSEPGPLYVIGVNTRGDVKGWIDYTSNKVIVAQVVDDPPSNISGISGNNKEIELIKDNLLLYNQLHELTNNILLYKKELELVHSKYDNTTQPGLTISDQKLIEYLQERIQETYSLSSMIKTQLKLPAN